MCLNSNLAFDLPPWGRWQPKGLTDEVTMVQIYENAGYFKDSYLIHRKRSPFPKGEGLTQRNDSAINWNFLYPFGFL